MLLQSCPGYIQAIGHIVPPLAVLGLLTIPVGAVAGKRLVAWVGDPKIGYTIAQLRNGLLGVTLVITLLLVVLTAWIVLTTPSACYRWFFFL